MFWTEPVGAGADDTDRFWDAAPPLLLLLLQRTKTKMGQAAERSRSSAPAIM